jgi:hypothetical protein
MKNFTELNKTDDDAVPIETSKLFSVFSKHSLCFCSNRAIDSHSPLDQAASIA